MINTRVFYRVVPPAGFSNINADTIEKAREEVQKFGNNNPNKTDDQKEFWNAQRALCKIVKVTETTEEVG